MYNDAVADCQQAITKDPDFAKAYLRRARAYRVRGEELLVFVVGFVVIFFFCYCWVLLFFLCCRCCFVLF